MDNTFDLIAIGAGSGGLSVVERASAYGVHGELVVKLESGLDKGHGKANSSNNLLALRVEIVYSHQILPEPIHEVKNEHDDCYSNP